MDQTRLLLSIAHHEAGHAFVGALMGMRIVRIRVVPVELDGQVEFAPAMMERKKGALIACAGIEAQRATDEEALVELMRLNPEYGEGDRLKTLALLSEYHSHPEELEKAVDRAFDEAAEIVSGNAARTVIAHIARELAAHSALPGDVAHDLIERIERNGDV